MKNDSINTINAVYKSVLITRTLFVGILATTTLAGCATTHYAKRNDSSFCRYTPSNTASYHPSCEGSCHAKLAGATTSTLEQFLSQK